MWGEERDREKKRERKRQRQRGGNGLLELHIPAMKYLPSESHSPEEIVIWLCYNKRITENIPGY